MANYFHVLFYLIDETCKNKQQEECINTLTRTIKNMIFFENHKNIFT